MTNLIRHCIVDFSQNLVVNVIDYESEQTGAPPGIEGPFLCVPSETGQIGDSFANGMIVPKPPRPKPGEVPAQ